MTSIERTAYPRFKRYYNPKELREIYTPTPSEKAFALSHTTGQNNYLNLMVLLKSFQRLGYFPNWEKVPVVMVNHLRNILDLPESVKVGYQQPRTQYRHRSLIRDYLQVKPFNQEALANLRAIISQSAQVKDYPADLINVAIEELVKEKYELPGFNTLDREVGKIRESINSQIFREVVSQLSAELRERLNALLEIHPVAKRSQFKQLKELPKRPTRNHLNDLLAHHYWLQSLGNFTTYLQHISQAKLKHFALEASVLDASAFCGTWEAVYLIDGLLQNKSDLQPDTIHGDTQGQSTPVFALSYLLGIKLMPRIRNWQDLIFYRPSSQVKYQHIDSFKSLI